MLKYTLLGITQDKALYDYFRCQYAHLFPAVAQVHRMTFVRQAANLWAVEEYPYFRARFV